MSLERSGCLKCSENVIRTKKRDPRQTLVPSKPLRKLLHLLRLVGFTLALLLLLFLFHLLTLGLPNQLTQKIASEAQRKGLPLQIESIRLSPHRGWVLRNVRLYSRSPDDLKPLFATEKLYVFAWPDRWLAPSKAGWKVSLTGKNSDISLGSTWETALRADNPFRTVDRLRASLHIQNKQLRLESSDLQWGGLRIRTRGQADFAEQPDKRSRPNFQTQAAQLANRFGTVPFETEPEINIDFYIDSAAPEKTSLHADVYKLPITHNDLTLNPLSCKLALNRNQLSVTEIIARVKGGGTLVGTFEMDIPAGTWKTALHSSGAHPDPIGTLVGPGLQKWIDRATFTNQPDIHVNLSYGGTKGSLKMDGTFSAENLTCSGGPLDTLEIDMAYSNRLLTLAPLRATDGSKQFDGTVHVDFAQKIAQFDIATNQFPLVTLARVLAPNRPSPLEYFAFNGPVTSEARGQIDYGTWTNHIVHGTLRAEQVSAGKIQADVFSSQIDCLGTQLNFTNTTIQLYNGTVKGSAEFDIFLRDGTAPYHIQANATRLDLKQMRQGTTSTDPNSAEGLLSGTLDITADAKADFWTSANGLGTVEIEKGRLARIPLLGGFSRLIPGTKIFSITSFFADYELRDEKLRSENIQLGGTLLSAQAHGSYSPTAGLNFRLRAAPLRNTREDKKWYQLHLWSAEALKKTTAPLFDLLEFNLKGTLEKPQWRLKALPKEIYEIIQRDKPEEPPQP